MEGKAAGNTVLVSETKGYRCFKTKGYHCRNIKPTTAANPKATTVSSSSGKFRKRTASTAGLVDKTEVKKSAASLKQILKWKGEFPWLMISDEDDTVHCSVFCDGPEVAGNNQFVTGCKPTKKETVEKHATSNVHMRAQNATLANRSQFVKVLKVSRKERKIWMNGTTGKLPLK